MGRRDAMTHSAGNCRPTPCSCSLDVTVVADWRLPPIYVVPD